MQKQIITIDKDKCIGCELCVNTCHQDAIEIIDGIATLVRDDYCDGLGNCLSDCPTQAISFKQVTENKKVPFEGMSEIGLSAFDKITPCTMAKKIEQKHFSKTTNSNTISMLGNWPVQIKLAPPKANFYNGQNLLIASDCCAYAYNNFHNDIIKNNITVIGCPKLDDTDYSEKLSDIISNNDIKSITLAKMEVPCCSKMLTFTTKAIEKANKAISLEVLTISTDGKVISN